AIATRLRGVSRPILFGSPFPRPRNVLQSRCIRRPGGYRTRPPGDSRLVWVLQGTVALFARPRRHRHEAARVPAALRPRDPARPSLRPHRHRLAAPRRRHPRRGRLSRRGDRMLRVAGRDHPRCALRWI
ncbi:MAG: hypothetical protein AVDCRST_MAG73-86, partial [uncultured Thermomicrobiales bacterium]